MKFGRRKEKPKQKRSVRLVAGREFAEIIQSGYTTLDKNPEVVSACFKISQLIASMTIYLMANTASGDIRVVNELSRKIDIEPNKNMTRSTWMSAICMNLLLYGNGNSVVRPHTENGLIGDLEPISAERVSFWCAADRNDYKIKIDDVAYSPDDLLHFVINPSRRYMWMGQGFRAPLKSVVENLAQAAATTKGFMQSKWKPSIIIKVDANAEEISDPKGRRRILDEYIATDEAGEPWVIPAELMDVEQIRPLSLADLAINDSVQLDKRTVAAVLGVPAFVLGVGEYKPDEWDSFINNTVRPIAQSIEQELTRKLILSDKMYLMFNVSKLYSYDLAKLSTVFGGLYNKGIITGNEVREKIGMQPIKGLDELIVLENYIPIDEIGNQKKLN